MYLTAKQLARRWHFRTTKRLYAIKEEIGYTKISGKLLFPIQQVEAYERQHTVLPKTIKPTTDKAPA